ncbi:MAG: type IV pilin protein [Trinickia sp.]|uniref:type IV pilin protein n=1 Tax=Trinickia sp. TaxID=2571163 RepID=UPI003F7E84E0
MEPSKSSSGFSLLELIIALAMAAVLAAYAVPSYQTYAARGHRVDAVVALHRAAQYVAAMANGGASGVGIGPVPALPPGLDRAPALGRVAYRLELVPASPLNGGYELRAVPTDDGPMRGDACGTFVLDGLGTRSNSSPAANARSVERCWSGRAA